MENLTLGTPAIRGDMSNPDKTGYIAVISEPANKTFTIGTGAMVQDKLELVIAWENETFSQVSENIAANWLERARDYNIPSVTAAKAVEMLETAKTATNASFARATAKRELAKDALEAFRDQIRDKIPGNAQAVIIAELKVDDCDTMSDYYGSTVSKTIILGFSTHKRDLFPEMRKASRNHESTAHLADGPASLEHREKYSMGGGYYLKDGYRHSDGWKVSKQLFYNAGNDVAKNIPFGEWAVPENCKDVTEKIQPAQTSGSFEIEEHTHTKKGFQMFICTMAERVEREEYLTLLEAAKALGGWYSRKWGTTPAGFAFKTLEAAQQFAGSDDTPDPTTPTEPQPPRPGQSDKMRTLAKGIQKDIDHKLSDDRLTNTPKRRREAASARHEGDRLKRTQQGLFALADMIDAGTVPPVLAKITTKKAAYDLAQSKIDHSNAGYYDAGIDSGEPYRDEPAELAFWELITPKTEQEKSSDKIRDKMDKVARSTIPGYFPTPASVIETMLERADIRTGESVLEPSAGSGAIMDAIKAQHPENRLVGKEINGRLIEILELKGHTVIDCDFLQFTNPGVPSFDKILMNPPFEHGQDMQHVLYAYQHHLKEGGRLVAIMAPGFLFKQDKKTVAFREWLDRQTFDTSNLASGTFKESGTMVNSVLITIEK